MLAWWELNADKCQGRWLREALQETAGRADSGDPLAARLIEILTPQAPNAARAPWVAANQLYLAYDEPRGCFRIDPNAFP